MQCVEQEQEHPYVVGFFAGDLCQAGLELCILELLGTLGDPN